MSLLVTKIYHHPLLAAIFHTQVYCLKQALKDCHTVLDLGCGPSSSLQYCPHITYSVGVEAFTPYLKQSQAKKIHTRYLHQKIMSLDFPPDCFDAVIALEVIEHLPQKDGLKLLSKMSYWAKKKVIVSSPNGFLPQKELDGNPMQKHLSGYDYHTMKKLGFNVRGLAGLKYLRQEAPTNTMGNDLFASIKIRPRPFWFVIATLSQLLTYYYPSLAFELFSVKKITP